MSWWDAIWSSNILWVVRIRYVGLIKLCTGEMTETAMSLCTFWKIITRQILIKKNVWFRNSSPGCVCNRTWLWQSSPKLQPQRNGVGSNVKNRTWYFRGISKWPVKIKGFQEALCPSNGGCQHVSGICCLMWLVKTVSYLKSTTSHCRSCNNDWTGAWKSQSHCRSQTRTVAWTNTQA